MNVIIISLGENLQVAALPPTRMSIIQSNGHYNLLFMDFQNTVHNRDVSTFHIEHDNITHNDRLALEHGKEQDIATLECGRHALASSLALVM